MLSLARIDLPTEGEAAACIEACLPALTHTDGLEVVAVVWEATTDASEVLDRLPAVLTAHRVPVLARLSVANGRLRFYGCSAGCCRVGAALPAVPRSVALVSSTPLPSREALRAGLQPGPLAACVGDAVERIGIVSPAQTLAAWSVILRSRSVALVETDDIARAVAGIADVTTRDALIARLLPGTVPSEGFPSEVYTLAVNALDAMDWGEGWPARLTEFAALVPTRLAAAPLTVCAAVFWGLGDGARARVCLDRAVEADPEYRLARLLFAMVELGIDPRAVVPTGERR